MPMLFTRNFMRSWINHLSNRDRYLHKIAQQTVRQIFHIAARSHTIHQATEIQAFVNKNPHLGFSLILQLTGVYGSQNFDKLTKTKTLGSIVSSMDTTGVQQYIQWLISQLEEVGSIDRSNFPLSDLLRNHLYTFPFLGMTYKQLITGVNGLSNNYLPLSGMAVYPRTMNGFRLFWIGLSFTAYSS